MPTLEHDGWELESGVARHAEAPDTFEIPDVRVREGLDSGWWAKLLFVLQDREEIVVERMWVEVTERLSGRYVGTLAHEPSTEGVAVSAGHRVEFTPDHVVDAVPPDDED